MRKKIPLKNYLLAFSICIIAILLTLIIAKIINVVGENKYKSSYLLNSKTITLEISDFDEIASTFKETPNEYFVYIGVHNSKETYNLEKKIKKIIDKYKLNDMFYYVDITEFKEEDDLLEKIKNAFDLNGKLQNVPAILYFRDGLVSDNGIVSSENIFDASDFEHLLDIYEFKVTK